MVCDKYTHVEFQCYAAAKVVAKDSLLSVIHVPTGIGKTYIAALIAKIYQDKGLKVAIVSSSEWLSRQMRDTR